MKAFLLNFVVTQQLHTLIGVLDYVMFALSCKGINPLNAELNPICYLLALLAHPIFHISRIRVNGILF
jgi:hypothetical protein